MLSHCNQYYHFTNINVTNSITLINNEVLIVNISLPHEALLFTKRDFHQILCNSKPIQNSICYSNYYLLHVKTMIPLSYLHETFPKMATYLH